jgi:hypothetical protein
MTIPVGEQHKRLDSDLTRRAFVAGAGAMGLLALAPPARVRALLAARPAPGRPGHFLTARELQVLSALADRLIPGPPEDPTPGAVEAGVPHALDLLLGAFELEPPLIHAGGPFSDRAGARDDDMARFVSMDWQAELAWRIRLEGSRGVREREFAGPVVGLQQLYRDGLAHLDQRSQTSHRAGFAEATSAQRDAILADRSDAALQRFVGAALANTLEAMYGPPEYGGNHDLVGWSSNGWAGDTQPRGFSRARVTQPDRAGSAPVRDGLLRTHGLPDLSGRQASRDEWWLRRGRLGRQ